VQPEGCLDIVRCLETQHSILIGQLWLISVLRHNDHSCCSVCVYRCIHFQTAILLWIVHIWYYPGLTSDKSAVLVTHSFLAGRRFCG
jgi:hypothetical protein